MGLAERLGCQGCIRRKALIKKLIGQARERWAKAIRPRTGRQK